MTSHGSGANGIEGTVNGAQDTVSVNAFRAQRVGLSGQNAGGTDEGNERARSVVIEGNAQSGVAQRGVSVDMAQSGVSGGMGATVKAGGLMISMAGRGKRSWGMVQPLHIPTPLRG